MVEQQYRVVRCVASFIADKPDCLTLFGAAERQVQVQYPRLRAAGIPVALATDDPAQMCTTIGRE
jgi:hypothetical protein